ncbi:MAG: CTP synthase, partial [Candidatus Nomurabacteria bacterium]|nr:CTP synthase [Candidatus Nomurabacteria bacterium]
MLNKKQAKSVDSVGDFSDKKTKYIFVTGGVISGVGKGITAASIGAILKAKGLKVSMQKCDPYLNVDAGLLNPREHGECFVTRDGAETDLDLGHYERFLDEEMTDDSILTSGKLYKQIIDKERSGGFGGDDVQLVPHVTGLIQDIFERNAKNFDSDVHITEIGGTIGDIEGLHFVEAIREFPQRVGRENCFYVHVVFVPYLSTSHEFKTKPAQNALRDLREFGIIPDMVAARIDQAVVESSDQIAHKIAVFSGLADDAVITLPNSSSVYEVPLNCVNAGALKPLDKFVNHGEPDMTNWQKLNKQIKSAFDKTVTVGLVAKYVDNTDTYLSVTEALKAAAWENDVNLDIKWINAEELENSLNSSLSDSFRQSSEQLDYPNKSGNDKIGALANKTKILDDVDGLLVPGGFGSRGVEGKIAAADYALKNDKPYLGICLGLQTAVIAAARRGGLENANTEEIVPDATENVIYIMSDQKGKESTGGTMRLGNYPAILKDGTKTAKIYKNAVDANRLRSRETIMRLGTSDENGEEETSKESFIVERHRHRYEVNQKF